MVALILGSILAVGVTLGYASTIAVDNLTEKIINDNLSLVETRVRELVTLTENTSKSVEHALHAGAKPTESDLTPEKLKALIPTLSTLLQISDDIYYVSITSAKTGEFAQASRGLDGKTVIYQLNQAKGDGTYHRVDWIPRSDDQEIIGDDPDFKVDSRTRPYFQLAKARGQACWTEPYEFIATAGGKPQTGITCATPIYDAQGNLIAVATADISLASLEGFLNRFRPADSALTMIMAIGSKEPGLIAHSSLRDDNPKTLEGEVKKYGDSVGDFSKLSRNIVTKIVANGDGTNSIMASIKVRAVSVPWVILAVVPESYFTKELTLAKKLLAISTGVLVLFGFLISYWIATSITKSIRRLAEEAGRIQELDLSDPPPLNSNYREIDELDKAIDNMRVGLRSFERLVPKDYVKKLIVTGDEANLGGKRDQMTAMFCDIDGFTGLAEQLDLDQTLPILNQFLDVCTNEVLHSGGTVDKFLGDEMMAFWGAPIPTEARPAKAVRTAMRIQARLKYLRGRSERLGAPMIHARVGIASGPMIVGNIGSHERMNYTVIGDRVNLASRLQGLNKIYRTTILMDEDSALRLDRVLVVRPVDFVRVVGREVPVKIYELLGLDDEQGTMSQTSERTNLAFSNYLKADFAEALIGYESLKRENPEDGVAELMVERCRSLIANPSAEWDGIHTFTHK